MAIDPNHPNPAAQIDVEDVTKKPLTNAERQRRHRERMKKQGLKARTMYLTDQELFYLERTLLSLREHGGYPATLRNAKGQMVHIDV